MNHSLSPPLPLPILSFTFRVVEVVLVLPEEVGPEKLGEGSVTAHQVLVGPSLQDPTSVHHYDVVR